jgi:hypothetical protein
MCESIALAWGFLEAEESGSMTATSFDFPDFFSRLRIFMLNT